MGLVIGVGRDFEKQPVQVPLLAICQVGHPRNEDFVWGIVQKHKSMKMESKSKAKLELTCYVNFVKHVIPASADVLHSTATAVCILFVI